jgi:hypothetical protein
VVNELGDPVHPESYSDRFEVLVRKSKLSKIRLHDARHTCGTLMHLRGVAHHRCEKCEILTAARQENGLADLVD